MSAPYPVAEQLAANVEHTAPTPWLQARQRLEAGRWYWLATEHPAGRPHVRPVLAVWLDDALYFVAGAASRKARNIAQNARQYVAFAIAIALVSGIAGLILSYYASTATGASIVLVAIGCFIVTLALKSFRA